ncbi:MAG: hypothetical protein ACR5LG_04985 [Sodalis sp. (in: enterobacteria)]|uniref:hypothetical protein n=1 Tax=Sodalis sp. (in: enterobacteria) TaxID=1898979 RepID=UPI003F3DF7C9
MTVRSMLSTLITLRRHFPPGAIIAPLRMEKMEMPEGPEIRRAADSLMLAMSNLPLTLTWFAFPHLKRWETVLTG